MNKKEYLPTILDNTLSTFEGRIQDARTLLIGIPIYLKTQAYTQYFSGTNLLRILKKNIEDNSMICRGYYYSMAKIIDCGDILSIDYDKIKEDIETIFNLKSIRDKNLIFIGGEHTFTYFIATTLNPENLVIFDAHPDLKDNFLFDRFNHATYLRRLADKNDKIKIYLVGVRSYDPDEIEYMKKHENITILSTQDLDEIKLKGKTHISIDLDVLDIKDFASTTYPEPLGLDFITLLKSLHKLISRSDVKTIDIMEYNPLLSRIHDSVLVLRLIYELGIMLEYKKCI